MSKDSINATHYELIPATPKKAQKNDYFVQAIIETPKGSPHKYALESDFGIIAFHDVLPDRLEWPYDYGFVPQTLAPDGDPLDILVLMHRGLFPGCFIKVRVLGAIRETKDNVENDRLIAVPLPSPGAPLPTDTYADITDLPKDCLEEIASFLVAYSSDQGHEIRINDIVGAEKAMRLVKKSMKTFKKQ